VLEVEHYELIRRKHEREGMSQRAIARELGHSRKTVAKALKERIPPGYRLSEPRPRPVIESVRHIIDAWLEQNKKARRKQRQTAKRIYVNGGAKVRRVAGRSNSAALLAKTS
jgi:transposase